LGKEYFFIFYFLAEFREELGFFVQFLTGHRFLLSLLLPLISQSISLSSDFRFQWVSAWEIVYFFSSVGFWLFMFSKKAVVDCPSNTPNVSSKHLIRTCVHCLSNNYCCRPCKISAAGNTWVNEASRVIVIPCQEY